MAWFILTSANLSKAAWGKLNKKRDQLLVMSWECGVMFLPKFLKTGESVFKGTVKSIDNGSRASSRIAAERKTVVYDFPIPYDLHVTPYTGANKPWLVDYLSHPRRR
jgi:tyrosyl-DNA phosphodiesterase-1